MKNKLTYFNFQKVQKINLYGNNTIDQNDLCQYMYVPRQVFINGEKAMYYYHNSHAQSHAVNTWLILMLVTGRHAKHMLVMRN